MSFYSSVNSLTNMHRAGAIPALENHSLLIKVRIASSLVSFIIFYTHILFFRLRWNTKSDKIFQLAEETRGFIAHFGSSPGRWRNLFCACESFGGEAAILAAFFFQKFPRANDPAGYAGYLGAYPSPHYHEPARYPGYKRTNHFFSCLGSVSRKFWKRFGRRFGPKSNI